jgi:rare lipoprotein A
MSIRTLAAGAAAIVLALAPLAHAQPAPAPVAAPAPIAAPAAQKAAAATNDAAATGGKVAYYGRKFAGRKTASGERFNPNAMTMAHKTLPFGTLVRVTNTKNKRSVVVRVNDRGPTNPDLAGDLSIGAAKKLNMLRSGVVDARFEVVGMRKGGKHAHAHKRVKHKARKA